MITGKRCQQLLPLLQWWWWGGDLPLLGCEKFLEDGESAEAFPDSVGWLALGSLMVFASHEARSTSAGLCLCLSSLWFIRGLGKSVGVAREEGLRSVPFPSLGGIRVCVVCVWCMWGVVMFASTETGLLYIVRSS